MTAIQSLLLVVAVGTAAAAICAFAFGLTFRREREPAVVGVLRRAPLAVLAGAICLAALGPELGWRVPVGSVVIVIHHAREEVRGPLTEGACQALEATKPVAWDVVFVEETGTVRAESSPAWRSGSDVSGCAVDAAEATVSLDMALELAEERLSERSWLLGVMDSVFWRQRRILLVPPANVASLSRQWDHIVLRDRIKALVNKGIRVDVIEDRDAQSGAYLRKLLVGASPGVQPYKYTHIGKLEVSLGLAVDDPLADPSRYPSGPIQAMRCVIDGSPGWTKTDDRQLHEWRFSPEETGNCDGYQPWTIVDGVWQPPGCSSASSADPAPGTTRAGAAGWSLPLEDLAQGHTLEVGWHQVDCLAEVADGGRVLFATTFVEVVAGQAILVRDPGVLGLDDALERTQTILRPLLSETVGWGAPMDYRGFKAELEVGHGRVSSLERRPPLVVHLHRPPMEFLQDNASALEGLVKGGTTLLVDRPFDPPPSSRAADAKPKKRPEEQVQPSFLPFEWGEPTDRRATMTVFYDVGRAGRLAFEARRGVFPVKDLRARKVGWRLPGGGLAADGVELQQAFMSAVCLGIEDVGDRKNCAAVAQVKPGDVRPYAIAGAWVKASIVPSHLGECHVGQAATNTDACLAGMPRPDDLRQQLAAAEPPGFPLPEASLSEAIVLFRFQAHRGVDVQDKLMREVSERGRLLVLVDFQGPWDGCYPTRPGDLDSASNVDGAREKLTADAKGRLHHLVVRLETDGDMHCDPPSDNALSLSEGIDRVRDLLAAHLAPGAHRLAPQRRGRWLDVGILNEGGRGKGHDDAWRHQIDQPFYEPEATRWRSGDHVAPYLLRPLVPKNLPTAPAVAVLRLTTDARTAWVPTDNLGRGPIVAGGRQLGLGHVYQFGYSLHEFPPWEFAVPGGADKRPRRWLFAEGVKGWEQTERQPSPWGPWRALQAARVANGLERPAGLAPRPIRIESEGANPRIRATIKVKMTPTLKGGRVVAAELPRLCLESAMAAAPGGCPGSELTLTGVNRQMETVQVEVGPKRLRGLCPKNIEQPLEPCEVMLWSVATPGGPQNGTRLWLQPLGPGSLEVRTNLPVVQKMVALARYSGGDTFAGFGDGPMGLTYPTLGASKSPRLLVLVALMAGLGGFWLIRVVRRWRVVRTLRAEPVGKMFHQTIPGRGSHPMAGRAVGRAIPGLSFGSVAGGRPLGPGDRLDWAATNDIALYALALRRRRETGGPLTWTVPRVPLRVDERAPRVLVMLRLGRSMLRPRSPGMNLLPKVMLVERTAITISSWVQELGGTVAVVCSADPNTCIEPDTADATAHAVASHVRKWSSPKALRKGENRGFRADHWLARRVSEDESWDAIVYITDMADEEMDDFGDVARGRGARGLKSLAQRQILNGGSFGIIVVTAPEDTLYLDDGVTYDGIPVQRLDWSPSDLRGHLHVLHEQVVSTFTGVRCACAVVSTSMDRDHIKSHLEQHHFDGVLQG